MERHCREVDRLDRHAPRRLAADHGIRRRNRAERRARIPGHRPGEYARRLARQCQPGSGHFRRRGRPDRPAVVRQPCNSQPGDNVVPNTDGDNTEATSTGDLNIKWGADNVDSGVDTTTGAFNSFVQDHPDGIGDRSLTFTNANVGVSGVSSLFSHGEAVSFSLNADGTVLTGTAGTRTVMQVSLSDDGTGQFRVVLLDHLDHAPGNSENDIGLTFNYTATDSDGDAVTGTFAVGVDDDVPVAAGSGTVTAAVDEDGLKPPDLSTGNADAGRTGEVLGTGSDTVSGGAGSRSIVLSTSEQMVPLRIRSRSLRQSRRCHLDQRLASVVAGLCNR